MSEVGVGADRVAGLRAGAARPRVSIGLPVYNGERFLDEAVASILGQTFTDLELIISDNASTDSTEEHCRDYQARDSRVRYFRSEQNRGSAWNHNRVLEFARGEYFKFANHDDVCHPDLIRRCVEALDARPEVVLCHALVADIDSSGRVIHEHTYDFDTASPRPSARFNELLLKQGGHDLYGLMRTRAARLTPSLGSYHQYAERVKVCSLALHGSFFQLPEVLFYHREHQTSNRRAFPSTRAIAPILDPRRGNRLLHPQARLHAEYVGNYVRAVWRAPVGPAERARCYRQLAAWVLRRAGATARRSVSWRP